MTNKSEIALEEKKSGPISEWLTNQGFENFPLKLIIKNYKFLTVQY